MKEWESKLPLVHIEVLRDLPEILAAEDLYRAFYARLKCRNPFLSWEWISSWLEAFGGLVDPVFVQVFSQDALMGILPFYWPRSGEQSLWLRFVGDQFAGAERLQPVVANENLVFVLSALFRELPGVLGFVPQFFWDDAPDDEGFLEKLEFVSARMGVYVLKRKKNVCPLLKLRELDAYPEEVQNHYRMAHNRLRRLYRRFGDEIEIYENEPDWRAQLEDLFRLHQKLWNRRGEPGSFADPRKREFYRLLTPRLLEAGKLSFFTMRIQGKAVASYYGFVQDDTYFYLQSGFDPDWQRRSVGTATFFRILQSMRNRGVRYVDFLRGGERYKFLWGAEPRYTYSIYLYPGRLASLPAFLMRWFRWQMRHVLDLIL